MKILNKKFIIKILLLLKSLRFPIELYHTLVSMFGEKYYSNDIHVRLASDWLINSQKKSKFDHKNYADSNKQGYSRGFYLYRGWDKGYIETTGYIIPTMYEVSVYLNDDKYKNSARRALKWLEMHQLDNGAFPDIDKGDPQAFDTGQILYGLNYVIENDNLYSDLAKKMAFQVGNWLCENIDQNGSWEKISFNRISHSYYSRVAAALYQTGLILNEKKFCEQATRNINWTLKQQLQNGFFDRLKFSENEEAFLHTMMYVVEGLIDYYKLLAIKDEKILDAILKMVNPLLIANLNKQFYLGSQYNSQFNAINMERCVTGIAQWSGVCLELFQLTKNIDFYQTAKLNIFYLKTKQIKSGNQIKGSLPGSIPIWGEYCPFALNNWPIKFFIDALILDSRIAEINKLNDFDEQENFVSHSFSLQPNIIATELSQTSQFYIKEIHKHIHPKMKIMDLGCGSGMIADDIERSTQCKIQRVDPVMHLYNEKIQFGSVHDLRQITQKFDLVYCLEVIQHSDRIEKFIFQLNQVLDDDGIVIIGDRHTVSIKYLLKSIKQIKGKWMYPWDSPFTEKWRSKNEFIKKFKDQNFELIRHDTFTSKNGRIPFMNRYQILVFKKNS